jgi:hypothetical protein
MDDLISGRQSTADPMSLHEIGNLLDFCCFEVRIVGTEYHLALPLRVCPKTLGGITEFSEHEAD